MSKLKPLLTLVALVIVALAATASAASAALPSILLLEGTSGTLTATSATGVSVFHSSLPVEAEGYKFELAATSNMQSSGSGTLTFENSHHSGEKCETDGSGAGKVVVPVTWNLALALGGGAKLFLILISPTSGFSFLCNSNVIKLTGGQLVDAEPFGVDTKSFTATTGTCLTGNAPTYKEFDNEAGTGMSSEHLSATIEEVKSTVCQEEVKGGTINFTASTMLEVMEP